MLKGSLLDREICPLHGLVIRCMEGHYDYHNVNMILFYKIEAGGKDSGGIHKYIFFACRGVSTLLHKAFN